jgi:hypothetical protein
MIRFPRVKEGEKPSAKQYNRLVDEVERLSNLANGGDQSVFSAAGGVFPYGKQPEWLRFELIDDLVQGGDPAEAKQLTWSSGYEFVDTGIRKNIYPDFMIGSIPSGTKVLAWMTAARWYTPTAGILLKIGKTDAELVKDGSAVVSIYDGVSPDALSDTGDNETVYNRFATVAIDMWVAIIRLPWGYEVIAAEC